MNHLPALEQRISMRNAERIAREITRRANRVPLAVRIRRHWRIYRRDYLLIAALIVLNIAFLFVTPTT
jgi:hypothetical protein